MPVITANLLGRFGNQAMQYLFARAYAEQNGWDFQCEPWIGQRIFELNDKPIMDQWPRRSELDLKDGEYNINLYGYAQHQRCMIYTKKQAQDWLKFRPGIAEKLEECRLQDDEIVAHRRAGDYFGYGYPVVSEKSYYDACEKFGLKGELHFVSEEKPGWCGGFEGELGFLFDFYRLMKAPILLRGNSTFSWFAALLGSGGR